MSDNAPIENEVKKNLPKALTWGVWIFITFISLSSLVLSTMAFQRSKMDSNALKSIQDITTRLEKTTQRLDDLARNSVAFNRGQSDYLHEKDQNAKDNYDDLETKYNDSPSTPDDGSNKWLFSQNDNQRSQ